MADGEGCKCAAHAEAECGCDADWTPQEVYDLRAENERLKEAIRRLAEQDATLSLLCKRDGSCVVTVTMDATLTDAEWMRLRGWSVITKKSLSSTRSGAIRTMRPRRGDAPQC